MADNLKQALCALDVRFGKRESQAILHALLLDLLHVPKSLSVDSLETDQQYRLEKAVSMILDDVPVQYVTQLAWFYGLPFYVDRHVLIPRPETEELVEKGLSLIRDRGYRNIIDIGCGSGIIPVVIKKKSSSSQVTGIDISETALNVSRTNAARHHADVTWLLADILEEDYSWADRYDLIISNPPYIIKEESDLMSASAVRHEPHLALFSETPLQFYRAILRFAGHQLMPGGTILLECNEYHAREIHALALTMGFNQAHLHADLQNKERILEVTKARADAKQDG